ncbi:hypothetical protein IJ135_01935 [Candidatus Saccharibacteria bacterium]|nr:hypothetical protein [Candidatus Saccharibacteria bacterium]
MATCKSEASSGNVTVVDKRDNKEYTVRYINDACWMTQNLQFTGTGINSTTTNINTSKTISYGDLTSGDSYTQARIHSGTDNNGNATVWYNFAAASAMTITGSSNSTNSTYDLCPKNWHLPSYNIAPGSATGITGYASAFGVVTGGYYENGGIGGGDYRVGRWWTSQAISSTGRYRLDYSWQGGFNTNTNNADNYDLRSFGRYIRCVRTS